MSIRARLAAILVVVLLVVGAGAVLALLPHRYWAAERLDGVTAFWHEDEAFVFVDHSGMGRSTSWVADRLPSSGRAGLLAFLVSDWRALGTATTAFRLAGGKLERHELPDSVLFPEWGLRDGRLQASARSAAHRGQGYAWNGSGFTRLTSPAAAPSPAAVRRVREDGEEDVLPGSPDRFSPETREALRAAGWHFKYLSAYSALERPVELALDLRGGSFTLRLAAASQADPLLPNLSSLDLSGGALGSRPQPLFATASWAEVTRDDFERRSEHSSGAGAHLRLWSLLALVAVSVTLLVLKLGVYAGGLWGLLGLKGRLVRRVATSYAFPSAVPEQFPSLDRPRLDQYSRDLERLGFERLQDLSPVADTPGHPAGFTRLYAHPGKACFGAALQLFPVGKPPLDLRCVLTSQLEDGWTIGFSNGKPLAAASLVRRPRAIGVNLPESSVDDLFSAFLRFRDQVCAELGVRPLPEVTLEAYVRRAQETLKEIRAAVQGKSMAVAVPQVYARKLAQLGGPSKEVWLGDYPRIAEERRMAGLGPGHSGVEV